MLQYINITCWTSSTYIVLCVNCIYKNDLKHINKRALSQSNHKKKSDIGWSMDWKLSYRYWYLVRFYLLICLTGWTRNSSQYTSCLYTCGMLASYCVSKWISKLISTDGYFLLSCWQKRIWEVQHSKTSLLRSIIKRNLLIRFVMIKWINWLTVCHLTNQAIYLIDIYG